MVRYKFKIEVLLQVVKSAVHLLSFLLFLNAVCNTPDKLANHNHLHILIGFLLFLIYFCSWKSSFLTIQQVCPRMI